MKLFKLTDGRTINIENIIEFPKLAKTKQEAKQTYGYYDDRIDGEIDARLFIGGGFVHIPFNDYKRMYKELLSNIK